MVKHSQSFQNSKFAMLLQYLKRESGDGADILHVDKYQRFLQIDAIIFGVCVCVCVRGQPFPNYPKLEVCYFFAIS